MTHARSNLRILREAGVYGIGTLAAQVVSAIRGLVIAGMLGPSSYGLWKSLQVGLDTLGYTHFGVLHGMSRRIPFARAEGDEATARAAANTGFRVALVSSLLTGCAVIVWTWNYGSPLRGLWIGIAGLLVLVQLIRYLAMRCQAEGRLEVLSFAELTGAVVSFAAMVALVPRIGVLGVLVGLAVGFSTAIAVAWFRGIFPSIRNVFSKEKKGSSANVFKELIATGFPFMFVDGLFVVWQRVDRLVLIFVFGAESKELGWYGLATMVASFAIQIPMIQMRVLFRRTLNAAGDGLNPEALRNHLRLPVLALAWTTPLLFGLGTAVSWLMVRLFLPAYTPAEPAIALLMLACYWTSVGISVRNLYTAMNRQWSLALIYGLSITASVVVILGLAWMGEGAGLGILVGGLGMLVGSMVFGLGTLWDNGRVCGFGTGERLRLFANVFWPFVPFAFWVWFALSQGMLGGEWLGQSFLEIGSCVLLNGPAAVIGAIRIFGKNRDA